MTAAQKAKPKAKAPAKAKAKAPANTSASEADTAKINEQAEASTQPPTPPANNKPEKARPVSVLFVRTKRGVPKFRRAGFSFTRESCHIALDALDAKQIKALKNEPKLEVKEGTIDEIAGGQES